MITQAKVNVKMRYQVVSFFFFPWVKAHSLFRSFPQQVHLHNDMVNLGTRKFYEEKYVTAIQSMGLLS